MRANLAWGTALTLVIGTMALMPMAGAASLGETDATCTITDPTCCTLNEQKVDLVRCLVCIALLAQWNTDTNQCLIP